MPLERQPGSCDYRSQVRNKVLGSSLSQRRVWSSEGAVTEQRVQRRLAAILAADVVGYSALMQRAEEATYAEFERLKRELIEPSLSRHDGRLIKTTGDGALAEFASPLAAVRCATEMQDHLAEGSGPFKLRIGLNLGDVIVGQDGDLYGDGINIAVRLEGMADPGGILMSEKVYSEVEGKLDVGFEDRGEQQLKNISKPVRAHAVRAGAHSTVTERISRAPPLPDKPSIAVLPFENMSGDPDQEYFADGIVEDVITALSRFKSLFVIARNSSFTYKGKTVDVKRVGRELGVRYVLEGSVRRAAKRLRITGDMRPTRPRNVTAKRLSPTRGRIRFDPAESRGSRVREYKAYCRHESSTGSFFSWRIGDGSPLYLTGLQPGRRYECTVRARSRAGWGPRAHVTMLGRPS